MSFTDRYRTPTRRKVEPGGNIVVTSKSIEFAQDGKSAVLNGVVTSGAGKGQNVTLRLSEGDAKVINKGLMKHAKHDGAQFYFTGVENKAGKNYRHMTLFAANPEEPGQNMIVHDHMVRPRVRFSKDNRETPVSISYQTFNPESGQDVPANFGAIKAKAAEIFTQQIADGRNEDGVGYLVHNEATGDTDFRTVTRRDIKNDAGEYVKETDEQLIDRFAREFLGADADPTDEMVADADAALGGYTAKLFPIVTYPAVGDTRAVELVELELLMRGEGNFTKLSTQIFKTDPLQRRVDFALNGSAIQDAAKTLFVDNFKAQASAVARAAFEANNKFGDLSFEDFRDFVRNVDVKFPQRNDGYGFNWARSCFVVGSDPGKSPIMKVMAPTVNRGQPLPPMPETRKANDEIFSWPKTFIAAGAEWDPSQSRDNDAGQADPTPAGQGDNDLDLNDLNASDLGPQD